MRLSILGYVQVELRARTEWRSDRERIHWAVQMYFCEFEKFEKFEASLSFPRQGRATKKKTISKESTQAHLHLVKAIFQSAYK